MRRCQNRDMDSDDDQIELTIRVTQRQLGWAVLHINNWIAEQPVNTCGDAHRFVSALTNPVTEKPVS
jgi:hypothetical protein